MQYDRLKNIYIPSEFEKAATGWQLDEIPEIDVDDLLFHIHEYRQRLDVQATAEAALTGPGEPPTEAQINLAKLDNATATIYDCILEKAQDDVLIDEMSQDRMDQQLAVELVAETEEFLRVIGDQN